MGVNVESFLDNFINFENGSRGLEVVTSDLIKPTTFPPALSSLELLQFCIDHYNVKAKIILSIWKPILSINKETISSILKLP